MALFVGTICGVRLPPTGSFRCQIPVRFGIAGEADADWALRRVESCSATPTASAPNVAANTIRRIIAAPSSCLLRLCEPVIAREMHLEQIRRHALAVWEERD